MNRRGTAKSYRKGKDPDRLEGVYWLRCDVDTIVNNESVCAVLSLGNFPVPECR